MTSELLRKATDIAAAATASGALVPLDTSLTHLIDEHGISFELRHLLSATPKHLRAAGPKPNPFRPWDRRLEVEQINDTHVVIVNKFPVQAGHMLLITQAWQPQTGWLSIEDWRAVAQIDATTTGLWFFNSGPDAVAAAAMSVAFLRSSLVMALQPCQGGSCVVLAEDGIEGESLASKVLSAGLTHAGPKVTVGFSTDLRVGGIEALHNATAKTQDDSSSLPGG